MAVCLFLLLVVISACGSGNGNTVDKNAGTSSTENKDDSKQVEITFANWIAVEDATKTVFEDLVATFEAANPNIKVKSIGIPFAQFKDQVLVNSAGGSAPDIMMSNQAFAPAFVGAGIVQPLDELLGNEIIDDIVEASRTGATYNGKVMSMPWAPHPNALFWNKTLFAKAGLDPEKSPTTWAEVEEIATKIAALGNTEDGKPVYGIGIDNGSDSNSGSKFWIPYLSYGGNYLTDGKLTFDQGTALEESLGFVQRMAAGKISPVGADTKILRGLFSTGSLGMFIDGDFGRNVFRTSSGKGEAFDKEWGVTTVPVNKTGSSETVFTEHQLLISEQTKNPEAAAAFVKFLVSKEAMIMYHKSNGVMSARKSLAQLPEMNEDDYAKVFNKQMSTATAFPNSNPKFDEAMKNVASMLQLVTVGNETPANAIKYVMPKIKELYE